MEKKRGKDLYGDNKLLKSIGKKKIQKYLSNY